MTTTTERIYLVHENGELEIKGWEPRTFDAAFRGLLHKKWQKSPKRLAASLVQLPDLVTVVRGLMECFSNFLEDERIQVEKAIAAETRRLEELAKDSEKPIKGKKAKEAKALKSLYKKLGYFDEKLWAIDELPMDVWIAQLKDPEYTALVSGIEEFLKQPVSDAWCSYCPALDSATGRAVEDMRLLSQENQEALGILFECAEGISLPVAVKSNLDIRRLNAAAKTAKIPMRFLTVKATRPKTSKKV